MKRKYRIPSSLKKREDANVIDMMASCLVFVMVFAMILVMMAYTALAQKRLQIDNVVRNYLYITEQDGYLSGDASGGNYKSLEDNLKAVGCTTVNIESDTTRVQVSYGQPVKVHVSVAFQNPIFRVIGSNGSRRGLFLLPSSVIPTTINYDICYESTSRW